MPFRFWLFVLWRLVKSVAVTVTFPIWGVGAAVIIAAVIFAGWIEAEVAAARRDWVRRQ